MSILKQYESNCLGSFHAFHFVSRNFIITEKVEVQHYFKINEWQRGRGRRNETAHDPIATTPLTIHTNKCIPHVICIIYTTSFDVNHGIYIYPLLSSIVQALSPAPGGDKSTTLRWRHRQDDIGSVVSPREQKPPLARSRPSHPQHSKRDKCPSKLALEFSQ